MFGLFGATADAFPFVFVQGRLRYGSRSSCCGLFLVFRGFRRQCFGLFCAGERSVFRPFRTRFRWCSAFSAPLPTRSLLCLFRVGCATVQGPAAAAFSLSFEGCVGNVSAFFALANGAFLAVLGPDLGGVRPFRRHCRRVPFCVCSG